MHWGVRRDRSVPKEVTLKTTPGKKVKAKGGNYQPASEDAKTVAVLKRTAKKSTTDSLSNKDLQTMVTRMNLEQQYSRLKGDTPAKNIVKNGKKYVTGTGGKLALAGGTYMLRNNDNTKVALGLKVADAIVNVGQSKKKKKEKE